MAGSTVSYLVMLAVNRCAARFRLSCECVRLKNTNLSTISQVEAMSEAVEGSAAVLFCVSSHCEQESSTNKP